MPLLKLRHPKKAEEKAEDEAKAEEEALRKV